MIFSCPECSAGHSVPVSMIPNGGLDMDCRRCGEAFTIEPPSGGDDNLDDADLSADPTDGGLEQAEKTSVGPPPLPEPTRVGVANPLDLEAERPLIGPGGIQYSQGGAYDSKPADDRPTAPFPTDHVPLSPAEDGLDPELDDTLRFDRPEDSMPVFAPSITEPGLIEEQEVSDASSVSGLEVRALAESSSSDSTPSVYERVAAGIAVPEDQRQRAVSIAPRVAEPKSGGIFGPVVDLLNRAPLALKVGLIVFPVTLGVMLVVSSMGEDVREGEPPIEIPIAAEAAAPQRIAPPPAAAQERDRDGDREEKTAAMEPAPKEEAAKDPAPGPAPPAMDDEPAPDGFAYVQMDGARLRVRTDERSAVAGRLDIGETVKVYDQLGEWALVAKLPDGPAGFLSIKLLGPRKPLAMLAREHAFERCSLEAGASLDDCLFSAKQQEQPCLDRCGVVNAGDEAERLRCAEVCSIAFDSCARSCRETPGLAKRKRRRR